MEAQQPENKTDILIWHGTWARRIADVRIRGFNATVHIGNKGAISLEWVWNLHSAETQVRFQNHPQKTPQGIQKRRPNTIQKQPQRPPENKKLLRHCQGQKKTNFGRPGPPSRTPKGRQIRPPNDLTSTQNLRFTPFAKKHELWCQFGGHRNTFRRKNEGVLSNLTDVIVATLERSLISS